MFQDINSVLTERDLCSNLAPQQVGQVELMRREGYDNLYGNILLPFLIVGLLTSILELNEPDKWRRVEHSCM